MMENLFSPIRIINKGGKTHYYNLRTGKTYSNKLILDNRPYKLLIMGDCLKSEYLFDKKMLKITFYYVDFNVNCDICETTDYKEEDICYIDNNYHLYDKNMQIQIIAEDNKYVRMLSNCEDLALNNQQKDDPELLKAIEDNFCPSEFYSDGKIIKIDKIRNLIRFILLECSFPNVNKKNLAILENDVDYSMFLSDKIKNNESYIILDKVQDHYTINYISVYDNYIDCLFMCLINSKGRINFFEKNKYGEYYEIDNIPQYCMNVEIFDIGVYDELLKVLNLDFIDLEMDLLLFILYCIQREQFLKFCVEYKYDSVFRSLINFKKNFKDNNPYIRFDVFNSWFGNKFMDKHLNKVQAFAIAGVPVDIWEDYLLYIDKDFDEIGAVFFIKLITRYNICIFNKHIAMRAYKLYIKLLKHKEDLDVNKIIDFAYKAREIPYLKRAEYLKEVLENDDIIKSLLK